MILDDSFVFWIYRNKCMCPLKFYLFFKVHNLQDIFEIDENIHKWDEVL